MVGKLGLVGGVAVAWLLTFVFLGGDVLPAITSSDHSAASEHVGAARPPVSMGPSPSASASPSDAAGSSEKRALGRAAAKAEELATASSMSGLLLTDRPGPRRAAPPALTFRLSTFNVLGSSHTRGGRKASGAVRATRAAGYIMDNKIDVIGFQELQPDQRSAFLNATGGRYGLFPGNQLRSLDGDNSIAYRLDTWEPVKLDSVPIPYFDGRPRNMPVILLKNKQTGITAYFTNFHNPASTRSAGNQARWRAAATARQASLFSDLRDDGFPVFVTGDMNERQSWFCAVAGPGDLKAAAGGEGGRNGCSVAGGHRIDWIAGSYDVQFSNYVEDKGALISSITDHPVMVTDVTVDAAKFPRSVLN